MNILQKKLSARVPVWHEEVQTLLSKHAETVVSEVTVKQMLNGWRGVNLVICDTSYVDPQDGLLIRGRPVMQLIDKSPEQIFFLLCTGELPTADEETQLREELAARADVPDYVWQMMDAQPADSHPMTLLSMAMLAMQHESVFVRHFQQGMSREEHWPAMLEDALNIVARLPVIAAGIYRRRILDKPRIAPRPEAGIAENFVHMLGMDGRRDRFDDYLRRFIVVHSDHEGANASVLTSRVVQSSLSDLYYSISASMNSLAGPLHGLANQTSVRFVLDIVRRFDGVPADEDLSEYVWKLLSGGQVIPGFGHAVLRDADPRYTALHEFGRTVCPQDPLFRIVEKLGRVVPPLLIRQGKAKNPYPNIDGISGTLFYQYGITDLRYYTVIFSVAQVLGICAQLIISRAVNSPLIRPRSVTTEWLDSFVSDPMD